MFAGRRVSSVGAGVLPVALPVVLALLLSLAAGVACSSSSSSGPGSTGSPGGSSSDAQPPSWGAQGSAPDAQPAGCAPLDVATCPDKLPSYATDITPILDRACNSTCHAPGAAQWPLTGYDTV